MRTHRRDGRLVVEAVSAPSQNYLHVQRHAGRLRLSFIDCSVPEQSIEPKSKEEVEIPQKDEKTTEMTAADMEEEVEEEEEDEVEEMEEEEEVEVVDRGIVVEVKVSTQPQQQSCAAKVHRSSLFINKFVGGAPLSNEPCWWPAISSPAKTPQAKNKEDASNSAAPPRRLASTATTTAAAAAVAAASTRSASEHDYGDDPYGGSGVEHATAADTKLLFTSRRRSKEELLHSVRRCSELRRRPLFIWEPCCIATS